MDFQKLYNDMPVDVKSFLLQKHSAVPQEDIRQREDLFIMYLAENNIEQAQEILDSVINTGEDFPANQVKAKPCKKCLSRYYTGKKVKGDKKVPILCKCFFKNLNKRTAGLNINWEIKE